MNKYLKVGASLALTLLLLAGCSGQNTDKSEDSSHESSSVSSEVNDPSSSTNPTTDEGAEKGDTDLTISDEGLTGDQEYSFEDISFTYNADEISVAEQGDGKEFMISLYGKDGKSVVPRIDILGMDTSDLSEAITKEQFEELALQLVSQYYGEDSNSVNMVPNSTVVSMDDPNLRTASTIVNVSATETVPSIYAEVSMQYNTESGAITILLLDEDASGDQSSPFMLAYESIKLN